MVPPESTGETTSVPLMFSRTAPLPNTPVPTLAATWLHSFPGSVTGALAWNHSSTDQPVPAWLTV